MPLKITKMMHTDFVLRPSARDFLGITLIHKGRHTTSPFGNWQNKLLTIFLRFKHIERDPRKRSNEKLNNKYRSFNYLNGFKNLSITIFIGGCMALCSYYSSQGDKRIQIAGVEAIVVVCTINFNVLKHKCVYNSLYYIARRLKEDLLVTKKNRCSIEFYDD